MNNTEPETRHIKYVYLDIVSYSSDRSVEAQTEIIDTLNALVKTCVKRQKENCEVIFIPTGDGICIAFIDRLAPYDIHIQFSLALLADLANYNQSCQDHMRRFEIRIGLNENVDNLITDINGHTNVAGAGVTVAQRVMSLGDGGNILISESVFNTLEHREAYMGQFKKHLAVVKHDKELPVYHLIGVYPGVNSEPPFKLADGEDPIDTTLRRCLNDCHYSTGPSCRCWYDASRAWKKKADEFTCLSAYLSEDEQKQFEYIYTTAVQLLDAYQKFLSDSYTQFMGTMFRQFCASKHMDLSKALANEMKWLNQHINERVENVREFEKWKAESEAERQG